MSSILECIGKEIKISKNSITIKDENGKTRGVVRNVISLHDIQPNKQIEYYKMLKEANLNTKISNKNCFIKDNELYILRNIKSKLFHDKYGYFSDSEKEKEKMNDTIYKIAFEKGFKVIECIF